MPYASTDPFKDILEGDFSQRIHASSAEVCSLDDAMAKVESWHDQGSFVVFKAGTFDVLTLNHVLGLIQLRALGAKALLGMDSIDTEKERKLVHEVAASDDIKLMISLDTNKRLADDKAGAIEKGGVTRPILDWYSRAMMLALQSIPLPGYKERRPAVDYITRHGMDSCAVCEDGSCTNENNELMAVELRPDLTVITEHQQSLGKMQLYKREGRLPDTAIEVIAEEDSQYHDPLLGGPIKTTSILNRIRS